MTTTIKRNTGLTDRFGNTIYENDTLFNYFGEEYTVSYDDGENTYETPGIFYPSGDYGDLTSQLAKSLSKDFHLIYQF